ncbi:patatin-like phospholipase family protein [Bradyrhizobium sp. Cp5.3]|uniref:patatin-like phospholipase family protein n=1 Tax=Bradyrhizobium sp. Cp5.3 TaxID=443598 RepID=UPI0003FD1C63|nr:patatin-like phospholipase family protein [Bradyrhizobium sp. Cp5.3]
MPQPVDADPLKPVVADIVDNGDVLLGELHAIEERRALLLDAARHPQPNPAPSHDPKALSEKLKDFVTTAGNLNLSALCLSGGGIRSAAFALGVVQGLAARRILSTFDYLSTVSGGGYTGAMLTAWVQRTGYDNVQEQLIDAPQSNATISPLQHLRRYSSYLSPSTGLLSTDMLALVALYVRNLLLNWFVLIPILLAAIILLKSVTLWAWTSQASDTEIAMLGLLAVALAGASMVDSLQQRPGWGDESSSRSRFLALELLPTLLAGLLISVAALKIYQQFVVDTYVKGSEQLQLLSFLKELKWYGNVAVIAAGTYFVAAVLALSFSPPRAGKDDDKSTSENIRSGEFHKGVLHRGMLIVLALTASGAVVGLLLARIIDAIGAPAPDATDAAVSPVKVFMLLCLGPSAFMTAVFLAELLYCALTGKVSWGDAEREWLGRAAGYHARAAVFWSLAFAVIYLGSYGINYLYRESVTSFSGLIATGGLAGVVASLVGKSSSTMAVFKKGYATLASRSLNVVLAVAATAFIIILTSVLSAVVDWLVLPERKALWFDEKHEVLWPLSTVLFWTVVVGAVASWFVNTNRFSLHGVYRNRLIRTFLGASKENRKPNAFTDFYEKDNLNLSDLWPNAAPDQGRIPPQYLVQNIAMNIVATRELAWQERKAMSFVVTPWWCGCGDQNRESQALRADLSGASGCYRVSKNYGKGISVGTSMAISGAAASPNMGYHSSPALSLLLTFFNVRLGAWLGNPNSAGNSTWQHAGPRIAGWPMIEEALGLTDGTKGYVYLSDGGHFDNLGLYEMVRRRCRLIIISDAGCDPDFGFEDLGNACRKISIDQDVDIEFEALKMVSRKTPPVEGPYFAVAKIKYRDLGGKEGILVYIKPNFQGIEPISVRSYALKATVFPHESTADQFFGESQFEAYRALGRFAIDHIDGAAGTTYSDVNAFVEAIRAHAAKPDATPAGPAPTQPQAALPAKGAGAGPGARTVKSL